MVTNCSFRTRIRENNEAQWPVLALAFVAQVTVILVVNGVLYQGRTQLALYNLQYATKGLVSPTLIAGFLMLSAMGVVIFGVGRLGVADVGWRLRDVIPALLFTAVFWVALHVLMIVVIAMSGGRIAWHKDWTNQGAGFILGGLMAQLIGVALLEETVWRGFFLPQFYFKASRFLSRGLALAAAIFCSQALFALP